MLRDVGKGKCGEEKRTVTIIKDILENCHFSSWSGINFHCYYKRVVIFLWRNRLANEQNIKTKETENEKIIEGFKNSLLLERGSFGFDFDMEVEDRLRTLFSVRKSILDIFD